MTDPTSGVRRCAVLGSPIVHSLSPVLHRAAYADLGLPWSYDAVEVAEAGLEAFVAGLDPSWRGLSLTMPLKRAVLPLLDEIDPEASRAGAANTLLLEDDGRRVGHNTDVPGAAAAIRERYAGPVTRAAVLGGGATAASTLLALADLGCETATLLVRDPARAGETLEAVARYGTPTVDVGLLAETDRVGRVDVLVSTIPAGAQTAAHEQLAARSGVVFDVVYDPWPTPLARAAETADVALVSGLDLLVHQAVLQVGLMTGQPGPLAVMRAAGEAALEDRARG